MNLKRCFFSAASTLLILTIRNFSSARPIKIGAIFHKGDEDYMSVFLRAISETRHEYLAPAFELLPITKYIDNDSFKTAKIVCDLLEEGVAAIFGPASPHTRGIILSTAARYEIPYIEYVWRENEGQGADKIVKNPSSIAINIFPDSEMVSQVIADVVKSMHWHHFIAIYEDDDSLSRLQKTLMLRRNKDDPIAIRQLGKDSNYRPMLKEIHSLSVSNVIIDVKPQKLIDVLHQAKEVKLLTDYCNFFITYLDSSKLPILEIRNGTLANITGLSLRENDVEGINWIESAILYDAVFLLQRALEALNARNIENEESLLIDPEPLSCIGGKKYQAGPNITSVMRELSKVGPMTGMMNIDEYGRRRIFNVTVLDFRQPRVVPKGYWSPETGLHSMQTEKELESYLFKSIQEKEFRITTREGPPYVMEVTDGSSKGIAIKDKRYEGYCIELIEHIAKNLGFKYKFEIVKDGSYGSYNPQTKTWDGLIGQLLDREADLAICDLTITLQRLSVVDFSMPFMNLGISILFNKSEDKKPNLFSFLLPLSAEVWIYMATAYLAVSIMLFLQARMAPDEWSNPHPCNAEPEELENNFNLKNSMWLTIGSLMQQGSDILPRAPSIRMLASMWWFFTLIMISSYTANLAAFLTADKMETPIKNVEDLAKQTTVKYGALEKGSTSNFFRNSNYSTYKRMWSAMSEWRPSVFTNNNNEGIERVLKGKRTYAFLMESTSIEYGMERNCELSRIGGLIDNKGYGIAMPRDSPYRTFINKAILTLAEEGTLQELKKKWWQTRGGGKCKKDEAEKSTSTSELGLANVGGVFLVLMCGCGASLIIAICEFLWNVQKVAVREKITPLEALVAELKFAVNIWAVTKPVKIAKSNSNASSIEGGLAGRAASTARSIVGSFLRLNMLDKYDKGPDNNRGNNDRKIN